MFARPMSRASGRSKYRSSRLAEANTASTSGASWSGCWSSASGPLPMRLTVVSWPAVSGLRQRRDEVVARALTGLGKPDKKTVRAQFWEGAGRRVG